MTVAMVSDQELTMLYYNCLAPHGIKKFHPLAENYALFDNLPMCSLIKKEHAPLYDNKAWGSNPG